MGCVFPMFVVSKLPHTEFDGRNDHREDAPHFTNLICVICNSSENSSKMSIVCLNFWPKFHQLDGSPLKKRYVMYFRSHPVDRKCYKIIVSSMKCPLWTVHNLDIIIFNKFNRTENKQSRAKSSFQHETRLKFLKIFQKFEVSLEKGSVTLYSCMIMKTRIFAYSHDQWLIEYIEFFFKS